MIKKINSIFLSLFTVIALLSCFALPVCAAGSSSTTLSLSPKKNSYSVGETFSLTLNSSASGDTFFGIDASLTFDSSVVKCTDAAGGTLSSGKVKFIVEFSGETSVGFSKTLTFQTLKEGSCYFNCSASIASTTAKYPSAAGWTIKVETPVSTPEPTPTPATPSSNANLASLKVSGAALSPKFASNKTSYSATVPYTTSKVTISAGVADAGATVVGAGTIDLQVGENKRTLTVTAASGAKKSYNITITRLAEEVVAPETPATEPENDPLSVIADGVAKKIMQDISSMPIPEGFTQTTVAFDDIEVGALIEGGNKYTLFYISNEDGTDPDLYYKNSGGDYVRLLYITVNCKFYIIEEPGNGYPPSGWKSGQLKLSNGSAFAFVSNDERLADFYVIYCYADGVSQFYRYDSLQASIQRSPDFALSSKAAKTITAKDENTFTRLLNGIKSISPIGIAVLCLAVLLAVGITVLAIFILKGSASHSNDEEQAESPDDNDNTAPALSIKSDTEDCIHTEAELDMSLFEPETEQFPEDTKAELYETQAED